MQSYLIPYVDPSKNGDHEDPLFVEFTYGDSSMRGGWLRSKVSKGDYLFFQTNHHGEPAITAYYYVDQVMSTEQAHKSKSIMDNYRNPHLRRGKISDMDTIVFGEPKLSKILKRPMVITREILNQLSGEPKSVTRPWVKLNRKDVDYLLQRILDFEKGI